MMVPVAYGIALVAAAFFALYVRRRFPAMPKRMPLGIGIDGRARSRAPRAFVWLLPGTVGFALLALGFGLLTTPPAAEQQLVLTLVLLELVVVVLLLRWLVDRLIELGRDQTYRVRPARLAAALLPTLAGIVLIAVVAGRL